MSNSWCTAFGKNISYQEMVSEIKEHVSKDETVFIGTDSQLSTDSCVFATVICFVLLIVEIRW